MAPELTVLDAGALVAALVDEPARAEVEAILRERGRATMSAVGLAEAVDVLIRVFGNSPHEVHQRVDWLTEGGLQLVQTDKPIARLAGELRARHYHRRDRPVSLADCIALASAIVIGGALATADPALAATADTEGVPVTALPDSQGRRPG